MKPTDPRRATDPDDGPPRGLLGTYFGVLAVLVASLVGLSLPSQRPEPTSAPGTPPPATADAPAVPQAEPPELPAPAGDEPPPTEWPPSF